MRWLSLDPPCLVNTHVIQTPHQHPVLLWIFHTVCLWGLPWKHTNIYTHSHIRFPSMPFLQQMNKCRTHSAAHQFCLSTYLLFGYLVYYSDPSRFHSSISSPLSLSGCNSSHSSLHFFLSHIPYPFVFFPYRSLSHSLSCVLSVIFCKVDKHQFPAAGGQGE